MANPVSFPNRPFNLRASVWVASQDTTGNRSKLGWELWIDKTAYSPTYSSGLAARWLRINGVFVHEFYGSGFDFQNGSNFLLASGELWVDHDSDGTKTVAIAAQADFALLGGTPELTDSITPPAIPRASSPTVSGSTNIDVGTSKTIYTNRASSAFTHTLELWEYGVGAQTPYSTIATGVGASYSWSVPASLATTFPNSTSKSFFIRALTYSGATYIGRKDLVISLRAPSSMRPTVTDMVFVDENTDVETKIGAYVQMQSEIRGYIAASGIQGSSIVSAAFTIGSTTLQSTQAFRSSSAGTRAVSAVAVDSRGRSSLPFNTSIDVLPYSNPSVDNVSVERADASGNVSNFGTHLKMTLKASASSLVVGTEKNSLSVEIQTMERGGSGFTTRNTFTHTSLEYDSTFMIDGGGTYLSTTSYEIRILISDELNTSSHTFLVGTSRAVANLQYATNKIAYGMMVDDLGPDIQIAGPAKIYGELVADALRLSDFSLSLESATPAEISAGILDSKVITPYGLAQAGVGGKPGRKYLGRSKWSSSGTWNLADYDNVSMIIVHCVGGGGAGGGAVAASSGQHSYGTGGGGGAYASASFSGSNIPETLAITVGSGGTPVTGGTGGSGGFTRFGTLVRANGGAGGQVKPSSTLGGYLPGGLGGTTMYSPFLEAHGSDGHGGTGANTLCQGGNGGPAGGPYGGGGGRGFGTGSGSSSGAGGVGGTYGGGGGGASCNAGGPARAGGAGAAGVVIIERWGSIG